MVAEETEETPVDYDALLSDIPKVKQPVPDYDTKGARKAGVQPGPNGHWPDTYKLPNHITFSTDSKYSNEKTPGGKWERGTDGQWSYTPSDYVLQQHPAEELQKYFREREPDAKLILSSSAESVDYDALLSHIPKVDASAGTTITPNRSVPLTDEQLSALPPVRAKGPPLIPPELAWLRDEATKAGQKPFVYEEGEPHVSSDFYGKERFALGSPDVLKGQIAGRVAELRSAFQKKYPDFEWTPQLETTIANQVYASHAAEIITNPATVAGGGAYPAGEVVPENLRDMVAQAVHERAGEKGLWQKADGAVKFAAGMAKGEQAINDFLWGWMDSTPEEQKKYERQLVQARESADPFVNPNDPWYATLPARVGQMLPAVGLAEYGGLPGIIAGFGGPRAKATYEEKIADGASAGEAWTAALTAGGTETVLFWLNPFKFVKGLPPSVVRAMGGENAAVAKFVETARKYGAVGTAKGTGLIMTNEAAISLEKQGLKAAFGRGDIDWDTVGSDAMRAGKDAVSLVGALHALQLPGELLSKAPKESSVEPNVMEWAKANPEAAQKLADANFPGEVLWKKLGLPRTANRADRVEFQNQVRNHIPQEQSNAVSQQGTTESNGNRGTQPEPTVRQEPGATEDVTQAASRLRQDENQGAAGTQEAQQAPQEEAVSKPADRAAAAGRVKFSPTAEWQEVPEGDVLPPGLEIRVDMATGKNYARSPGGVETTPPPAEAPPKAKKPLRQPEPPNVAPGASETGEARNPPEAPGTPESTPEEGDVKRFGSVLPNPLVAVMPEGHGHFFRNAWDQIRGMFGSSVAPRLSKLAPNAVIAGQAHAGATTAAEPIIRDWFRKVFGNDWKNEELLAKFSDIQNADNILDIYDQAVKRGDTKGAEAIAAAHDLEELKDTVFRGSMDPKIKNAQEKWKKIVNPELDKWYNQAKRIDPDTPQVGRGRYTGVRINLVTKDRAATWAKPAAGENALPDQSVMGQAASYRNPDVKRDPFMRRAKGTGDYSTDLKTNMLSVVGPRWNQVSKIAFYESLINDGVAIEEPQPPPGGWGVTDLSTGKTVNKPLIPEGYKRMPMDMPITDPVTGVTKINERGALYVHPDVWQEVRNILGTEMKDKPFWWAQGLTAIQIASQMDAVSHGLTHMRIIANALAQTSFAGKIPLLDSLVSVKEMVKSATDVLNETPESLERIAKLAKAGNLRPHYETGGFGSKIALGAKFLRTIDTADRVIFDKLYDTLVERGVAKEEGRNEYMQAFGNYNRRMMKGWERTLRDIGASPFLSGGKMAMRLGRKMMTGDPGFKAASWKAVATTRANQLAKVAITYTVMAPLANYLLTGQFGGRPGTPLGAIDLGDDDKGQRKVLDIPQVIGLKRGLRLFGISAMVEGFRQGKNFNQIMGNMVEEIGQTWMHPLVGPGLSGIYAAASGKQAGLRGRMEAEKIPEGGFAQYEENTRAMAESQNPLLYHAGEHMIRMFGGKVGDPNADWTEVPKKGLLRQASRSFGLTTVPQPSDAAETLARTLARGKLGEGLTAAEKAKIETKKPLLKKLKQGEGQDELDDAVQDGKLTHREAANLTRHAGKSDLSWNVQGLSVDEFKMVWDQATPTQKEELRPLAVRRNRLKHSPEEHDTLNSIIDED